VQVEQGLNSEVPADLRGSVTVAACEDMVEGVLCTLDHSFASESPDLTLEIRSSGSESIGNFSWSSEFRLEEEGCCVQCIGEKMSSPSRSVQSCILQWLLMHATPSPWRGESILL